MLKLALTVKVIRRDGREELVYKGPSRSYLGHFAKMLFGVLDNSNQSGFKDTGGAAFTLRSGGDMNASVVEVALGTGTADVTPDDYTLTNLTKITTYRYRQNFTTWGHSLFIGLRCAEQSESWSESGLVQDLYDGGGVRRETLLARDVFPSTVSLDPGDLLVVAYRIVVAV